MNTPLINKAKEFATKAHEGQFRKGEAREPYTVHLAEVAKLVEDSGGGETEVVAAWLHDTIEDTAYGFDDVQREFGEDVAHLVQGLTDAAELADLPTLERKKMQARRVAREGDSIKRIKLSDQISNLRSLAISPPIEWDTPKSISCIEGARLIAAECRGVSPFLNEAFGQAYKCALQKRGMVL